MLPLTGEPPAQQDHNNNRVHRGEEQDHMDRTTRTRDHRGGGAESPTQHRCDAGQTTTTRLHRGEEGDPYPGGLGG